MISTPPSRFSFFSPFLYVTPGYYEITQRKLAWTKQQPQEPQRSLSRSEIVQALEPGHGWNSVRKASPELWEEQWDVSHMEKQTVAFPVFHRQTFLAGNPVPMPLLHSLHFMQQWQVCSHELEAMTPPGRKRYCGGLHIHSQQQPVSFLSMSPLVWIMVHLSAVNSFTLFGFH